MFNRNYDAKIRRLVLGAWNDDAESFAELYSLTVDDIYNYCMHILDDKKESLQAVNEIYFVAKDNILKLKDPSLFPAWLRRIAFDVCYRKAITSSRTDLFTLLHPDELLSLPFFERQIFFLHDFTGLSDKEIANALHIRKKHVLKILTNAREHMLELRNFTRS
ncbi:RNA polymerase sigma factor [Butyrivibrio sp. JL13D10]|uniref:RNA polymerase sigma factor n=1 Tax=Butyrivibrio sp. JL13D10 TaxID=3236815 RepID=UPI0038B4D82A